MRRFILYAFLFSICRTSLAIDYNGSSFISRDPVIDVYGGNSTSSNFQNIIAGGQVAIGESSSSNFILRAGFLYFTTSSAAASTSGGSSGSGGVWIGSAQQGGFNLKGDFHQISFEGISYQGAPVIVISNGQIITTQFADNNGNFNIFLGGLAPGNYKFGLLTVQPNGASSPVKFYDTYILNNTSIKIDNINLTKSGLVLSVPDFIYSSSLSVADSLTASVINNYPNASTYYSPQKSSILFRIVKVFASKIPAQPVKESISSPTNNLYIFIFLIVLILIVLFLIVIHNVRLLVK